MTSRYTHQEQRVFKSFEHAPTPRGERWRDYIAFKLKMFANGIAIFTRRKYSQLAMHRYIQTNRAIDNVANQITNNQPTIVYFGDAIFPSDSPIGMKGKKRCPAERKVIVSLKKPGKTDVRFTSEAYSSQTCPHCKRRLSKRTKSDRYKMCINCPGVPVATAIVTDRSRRRRQRERKQIIAEFGKKPRIQPPRAVRTRRHREKRRANRPEPPNDTERRRERREQRRKLRQRRVVAGRRHIARHRERSKKHIQKTFQIGQTTCRRLRRYGLARVSKQPRPQPNDSGEGELGSKKIIFEKTWHSNPTNGDFGHAEGEHQQQQRPPPRTIVFHRDISAALCILYIGEYTKNSLFVVFQMQL